MRLAYNHTPVPERAETGFTIVELLIVVVVIGILAAISVVAYTGVQTNAAQSVLKSDLKQASTQLDLIQVHDGEYPDSVTGLPRSSGTNYDYTGGSSSYCLTAWSEAARTSFHISSTNGTIQDGPCDGHTGYSGGGPVISAISAGGSTTCAVSAGRAYCWGYGNQGLLGNNGTSYSTVPVAVSISGAMGTKSVTDVSVSSHHACAVAGGLAYCWGNGSAGRRGDGTTVRAYVPAAVSTAGVLAGKTVTAISAGATHSCAIADGQAYCWGGGDQLGDGVNSQSLVPVAVSTSGVLAGKTVTAISAGTSHTCAIADSQVFCWGNGQQGQLGHGSTASSPVPVAVSTAGVLAGRTVTGISGGNTHTCAVADGEVFCWGQGTSGQLGDGNAISSNIPVAVSLDGVLAGKTFTNITVGQWHTCAIADSEAYCWGFGGSDQLGDGVSSQSTIPVAVSTSGVLAGKSVTAISAGNGHTCAIADGRAHCWGSGSLGQLGHGSTAGSNVPVAASPLPQLKY